MIRNGSTGLFQAAVSNCCALAAGSARQASRAGHRLLIARDSLPSAAGPYTTSHFPPGTERLDDGTSGQPVAVGSEGLTTGGDRRRACVRLWAGEAGAVLLFVVLAVVNTGI